LIDLFIAYLIKGSHNHFPHGAPGVWLCISVAGAAYLATHYCTSAFHSTKFVMLQKAHSN